MAGFAGAGLGAGSATAGPRQSVVAWVAGFAGDRFKLPAGRASIPVALKYAAAVSRRTPMAR